MNPSPVNNTSPSAPTPTPASLNVQSFSSLPTRINNGGFFSPDVMQEQNRLFAPYNGGTTDASVSDPTRYQSFQVLLIVVALWLLLLPRLLIWHQRSPKSTWISCGAAQNTLAKLCLMEHVNPKLGLQKCRRDMVVLFYLKPSSSFVFLTMPPTVLRPSPDKPVVCIRFSKTMTWSKTLFLNKVTMNTARTESSKQCSIFR